MQDSNTNIELITSALLSFPLATRIVLLCFLPVLNKYVERRNLTTIVKILTKMTILLGITTSYLKEAIIISKPNNKTTTPIIRHVKYSIFP